MSYQQATVYFWSGTGNSYRAATWLAETAQEQGIPARVVPIAEGRPSEDMMAGPAFLLALVMPTHGFTAPWQMIRFVLGLPRGRATHALVMPTRAGTKFGSLYLPGLAGTAGYLLALLLALKGYSVRGVQGLDMPSNWTALHPGFSPQSAQAIVDRARPRAQRFATAILSGGRRFGGWLELLFGLALLPVSMGYLLAGRFFLARLFFASSRCDGCGLCARHCPEQAIDMRGSARPRPYWTYRCESCMRCMNFCPQQAVEAGQSWGVLLYYVTTIPATTYLLNWLAGRLRLPAVLAKPGVQMLLQYPYMLLSISLAYFLFSLLIRVPAINRFFTVTTLTHYYRRYREPGTHLRDLSPPGKS